MAARHENRLTERIDTGSVALDLSNVDPIVDRAFAKGDFAQTPFRSAGGDR